LQRAFALLLEADEALAVPARTIDPQLVLEMAVLRLATLGPLVPLDELTRRLEALAGSAPAPRATTSAAPVARPAPPVRSDVAGVWDAMLQRLQEEKLSLYMTLIAARPLALDGGTLRLGLDNEAMRRELSKKESLDVLRTIAGAVAGRALQIEIG